MRCRCGSTDIEHDASRGSAVCKVCGQVRSRCISSFSCPLSLFAELRPRQPRLARHDEAGARGEHDHLGGHLRRLRLGAVLRGRQVRPRHRCVDRPALCQRRHPARARPRTRAGLLTSQAAPAARVASPQAHARLAAGSRASARSRATLQSQTAARRSRSWFVLPPLSLPPPMSPRPASTLGGRFFSRSFY